MMVMVMVYENVGDHDVCMMGYALVHACYAPYDDEYM